VIDERGGAEQGGEKGSRGSKNAAIGCTRIEEMEELALGHLSPAKASAARGHLATCASCADAHAMFEEERALFAERAVAIATPPLTAALPTRPAARDLWSITRIAAAAFACAAAIVCVVRDQGSASLAPTTSLHADEARDEADRQLHASVGLSTPDEGLACAYPASGFSHGSLASLVTPVRGAGFSSLEDRIAICEDNAISSTGP